MAQLSDFFIHDCPAQRLPSAYQESSSDAAYGGPVKRARTESICMMAGTLCQTAAVADLSQFEVQPLETRTTNEKCTFQSNMIHVDCSAESPTESANEEGLNRLNRIDFSHLIAQPSMVIGTVKFSVKCQDHKKFPPRGKYILWKQSNHVLSIWLQYYDEWTCLFWTLAKATKFFGSCSRGNFGVASYLTISDDERLNFEFNWHIPLHADNSEWFKLTADEYRLLISEPHYRRLTRYEKGLRTGLVGNFLEAMIPESSSSMAISLPHISLSCNLLPYQRETVYWMLQKEGKYVNAASTADPRWIQREGHYFYPYKLALSRCQTFLPPQRMVKGGILCDELGLGKTLQMLSVILLNPCDSVDETFENFSRATLIVTPATILPQWVQEISSKAPSLKYFIYKGISAFEENKNVHFEDLKTQFDIIITDFETLRKELHFALPDNSRSRRFDRKYERKISPLVQLEFWRLCIDEAQMIDANSNIGKVTRMVRRRYSWAMSGTPLGSLAKIEEDLEDLAYILFIEDLFQECVSNMECLLQLFKIFMRGNSKASVATQIRIPPQTENVIYVNFAGEELHYYNEHRLRMWQDFNNDRRANGSSLVEKKLINTWFLRLRQTCTHPNIGRYNHQLLNKMDILTMASFLDELIKSAEFALRKSRRQYLALYADRGMMFELIKNWEKAIADYEFGISQMHEFMPNHQQSGENDDVKFAWVILRHRLCFCLASVYNEIKSHDKSTKLYEEAEGIRAKLMEPRQTEVDHAINHARETLKRTDFDNKFVEYSTIETDFSFKSKSVISALTFNHVSSLFDALMLQSEHITTYRSMIMDIAFSSLHQNYAEDAERQHDGDTCLNYYKTSILSRKRALMGFNHSTDEDEEDILIGKRAENEDNREIPALMTFFEHVPLQNSIRTLLEKTQEIEVAEQWRLILKNQLEFVEIMEVDLACLTKLWNRRIEFYRLLQKLSDEVAIPEEQNPAYHISKIDSELLELKKRMDLESSKIRYLQNLRKDSVSGTRNARCIICYEDIHEHISISLTRCGHMFCHACIRAWLSRQLKCPACKTALKRDDVKRVFTAEKPLILDSDSIEQSPALVNSFKFPINLPVLNNSYSSKIDLIMKHVKYLVDTDASTKILVFSQWNDVLTLLETAMTQENISCLNMMSAKTRGDIADEFKHDDSNVLFLNLRAQSSGLTVTEASHVILVEPTLDKKSEQQAKGRVHRIGQTKPTWTHYYIVKGSIEEEIWKAGEGSCHSTNYTIKEEASEDEIIDLLNRELDMVTFI